MLLDKLCPLLLCLVVLFYLLLLLLLLLLLEKKPAVVENVRVDYMFSASDVLDRMPDWAEEEKNLGS